MNKKLKKLSTVLLIVLNVAAVSAYQNHYELFSDKFKKEFKKEFDRKPDLQIKFSSENATINEDYEIFIDAMIEYLESLKIKKYRLKKSIYGEIDTDLKPKAGLRLEF